MILKDGGRIVRKFPFVLELIFLEKLLRVKMRDSRKMKILFALDLESVKYFMEGSQSMQM